MDDLVITDGLSYKLYQTALRMPLTLKEDMTTICDRYQINESDLMRRAIVEFVTHIQQNPNQTSRHMFL